MLGHTLMLRINETFPSARGRIGNDMLGSDTCFALILCRERLNSLKEFRCVFDAYFNVQV